MISLKITGLTDLRGRFNKAPDFIEKVIGKALKNSIAMVETEAKRLTPVDTGLLRSSIGGTQGYSYIKGLTAGVGTNVKYAVYVNEGSASHKIGQSHFMEDGVKNATSYIKDEFKKAMITLSEKLTK